MILCTAQFDFKSNKIYKRLLNVFVQSVKKYIPEVDIRILRLEMPRKIDNTPLNFTCNTIKLKAWVDFLGSETDDIIFSDCDMICSGNPLGVFDQEFDVAYTSTGLKSPPMNGGMLFVRNNQRSLDFFTSWLAANNKMYYDDKQLHAQWRAKYLGMNQAAFGYLINNIPVEAQLLPVPTQIYNAVDTDWKNINDLTCFIHIKSELRRAVLNNMEPHGACERAMRIWYEIQAELPVGQKECSQEPKKPARPIRYRRVRRRGKIFKI